MAPGPHVTLCGESENKFITLSIKALIPSASVTQGLSPERMISSSIPATTGSTGDGPTDVVFPDVVVGAEVVETVVVVDGVVEEVVVAPEPSNRNYMYNNHIIYSPPILSAI